MISRNRDIEVDFSSVADCLLGTTDQSRTLRIGTDGIFNETFGLVPFDPDGNSRQGSKTRLTQVEIDRMIAEDISLIQEYGSWDKVVCFVPPLFRGDLLANYIEAVFGALKPGGRIILSLVGPLMYSERPQIKEMRRRILESCGIRSIVKMPRMYAIANMYAIDFINGESRTKVDYYVLEEPESFDDFMQFLVRRKPTFTVSSNELCDRWDEVFLRPENEELRRSRRDANTMRLGDVANVMPGAFVSAVASAEEREYTVLTGANLRYGEIDLNVRRQQYADAQPNDVRFERATLRRGDIIVARISERLKFAKYTNSDGKAVAQSSLIIIRPKQGFEEIVNLYFETTLGQKSLNSQAELIPGMQISTKDLRLFVIPDVRTLQLAARIQRHDRLDDRISLLFESEGWAVVSDYRINGQDADTRVIGLKTGGSVVGIVECRRYIVLTDADRKRFASMAQRRVDAHELSLYLLFIGDKMYRYENGGFYRIPDIPTPDNYRDHLLDDQLYHDDHLDASIKEIAVRQTSLSSDYLVLSMLENLTTLAEEIRSTVKAVSLQLQELSNRITIYQDLISKQISNAGDDPQLQEYIYKSFADTCAERIANEVRVRRSEELYADEQRRLIESIGKGSWEKLGEEARRFLVSSKFMYTNLADVEDVVDYSGVCLLVTKALELELGKRFFGQYIQYYREKHPGRAGVRNAPNTIVNRYHNRYLRPERFSLGSFAYIVSSKYSDGLSDGERENIKNSILDYAKNVLVRSYAAEHSDDEVLDVLYDFADDVDRVRENYRNPSAHTGALTRIKAKECFDFVIDVEQLLRKMLETFDE